MIEQFRYIWQLLLSSSLLILGGILLLPHLHADLTVQAYLSLVLAFTLINFAAWMIMFRGIRKKKREGAVILLAGISAKFLLYLLYILVFWLVTKNITKAFILTFFALYLFFTFFIAGHLLKALKNKQLH